MNDKQKKLELPEGWELYDRREKEYEGDKYFYNRYVHRESESGMVYFSTLIKDKKVFVVEGYGIGTIDPEKFVEISDIAPIQRYEIEREDLAEKVLIDLMNENIYYWRKYSKD